MHERKYHSVKAEPLCASRRRLRLTRVRGLALYVLFVCTGNICRSPTAERLAAAYATELQMTNFTALSAGTRAVIDAPIHPSAATVLENLGGDSWDFAARQLTPRIAAGADLVLAMTRAHRDSVLELVPHKLRSTFTLAEASSIASKFDVQHVNELASLRPRLAVHDRFDIPDPIGKSPAVFSDVGSLIASLLPPIIEVCRRSCTAEKSTIDHNGSG